MQILLKYFMAITLQGKSALYKIENSTMMNIFTAQNFISHYFLDTNMNRNYTYVVTPVTCNNNKINVNNLYSILSTLLAEKNENKDN